MFGDPHAAGKTGLPGLSVSASGIHTAPPGLGGIERGPPLKADSWGGHSLM